jgi:hypothetical protein
MPCKMIKFILAAVVLCFCSVAANADTLPVAVFSFDDLGLPAGSPATFGLDLTNYSGPSEATDVFTMLGFEDLSLQVKHLNGSTSSEALTAVDVFGDFSTGEAYVGGDVISAVLTGEFIPTVVTLDDGSTVMIASSFSATITDASGPLQDGDFALVNVVTSPIVRGVPEPETRLSVLLGLALVGVLALVRR